MQEDLLSAKQEIDLLVTERDTIQNERDELWDESSGIHDTLVLFRKQLSDTQDKLTLSENRIARLKQKRQDLKTENEELSSTFREMRLTTANQWFENEAQHSEIQLLRSKRNDKMSTIRTMRLEITNQWTSIKECESKNKYLSSGINEKLSTIHKLRLTVADQCSIINEKQRKIRSLKSIVIGDSSTIRSLRLSVAEVNHDLEMLRKLNKVCLITMNYAVGKMNKDASIANTHLATSNSALSRANNLVATTTSALNTTTTNLEMSRKLNNVCLITMNYTVNKMNKDAATMSTQLAASNSAHDATNKLLATTTTSLNTVATDLEMSRKLNKVFLITTNFYVGKMHKDAAIADCKLATSKSTLDATTSLLRTATNSLASSQELIHFLESCLEWVSGSFLYYQGIAAKLDKLQKEKNTIDRKLASTSQLLEEAIVVFENSADKVQDEYNKIEETLNKTITSHATTTSALADAQSSYTKVKISMRDHVQDSFPSLSLQNCCNIVEWLSSDVPAVVRTQEEIKPWIFLMATPAYPKSITVGYIRSSRYTLLELFSLISSGIYNPMTFALLNLFTNGFASSTDSSIPLLTTKVIEHLANLPLTNSVPAAVIAIGLYHLLHQVNLNFPGTVEVARMANILQLLDGHIRSAGDLTSGLPLPLPLPGTHEFQNIKGAIDIRVQSWISTPGSSWIIALHDHAITLAYKSLARYTNPEDIHVQRVQFGGHMASFSNKNDIRWIRRNIMDSMKLSNDSQNLLDRVNSGVDLFA